MTTQIQNFADLRHKVTRTPLASDEPITLTGLFRKAAADRSRRDALNFKSGNEWKSISSEKMISRIERIALGLYSLGIRKGDRVAILSANSPEWTLTDAACQFIGAIDVPIYTTLAPSSIEYILKDAGARILVIENQTIFERLQNELNRCFAIERFIFFDPVGVNNRRSMSLADLEIIGFEYLKKHKNLLGEISQTIQTDDIATLIYTSGTTGDSKGVMLSHANLISNVLDAGADFAMSPNDIALSVLPLSHVFERTGMYLYIWNGMAVYYAESIEKVPDNLREVRPTIFVGVPRIFEKVYSRAKERSASQSRLKERIFDWAISVGKDYAFRNEHREAVPRLLGMKQLVADRLVFSKFREFFGGRLRMCITGGAALSDTIAYIFNGAGVAIMQGYGLTETSPVISTNTPAAARVGTVGRPIRNVQVRIAADGEIEVIGPNVMHGYFNKPEATREAFSSDGWFRTGDIGELNGDGFLKITDRKKELFKTSGGKYIAPAPIEQMLKASRFVNQVVLVGNECKFPAALIVPNFEPLESYAHSKGIEFKSRRDLINHPRIVDLFERQTEKYTHGIAQYEKVKKIALLENELTVESGELTPTLKVRRRIVDEKYRDVIRQIYRDAERK